MFGRILDNILIHLAKSHLARKQGIQNFHLFSLFIHKDITIVYLILESH